MLEEYVKEMKRQQENFYARKVNQMLDRYDTVRIDMKQADKETFDRKMFRLVQNHWLPIEDRARLYQYYKKIYNQ